VSLWCKNIRLSDEQMRKLLKSKKKAINAGLVKGTMLQKNKKINALKLADLEAKKLKRLTRGEFWIAGLALYLAEGSKKMDRAQFTNSDPRVINFMLKWFKQFHNITADNIKCSILINSIHKKRDAQIKKFWQKYFNIKPKQFTSIRYIETRQRKIYANHNNYFGTFSFRINKSTHLLYRLKATIDRLLTVSI